MSKKIFGILFVLLFSLFAICAYAESEEIPKNQNVLEGMKSKLQRGLIDALTGCAEFPYQIVKGYNEGFMGQEGNKLFGAFFGLFKGIGYAAGRTVSGVRDAAFFWAASSKDNIYVGTPLDAEYVWEEGVPYDMLKPDFTEATIRPMVNKLFRGAGNTLFGFVEVPNQIRKGISGRAWDLGIGKGLYFWLSREISGVLDLATVPCANHEYNAGGTFDEDMPWEVFFERKKPKLE